MGCCLQLTVFAPAASHTRQQPSIPATFPILSGTLWQHATLQLRLEHDAWNQSLLR